MHVEIHNTDGINFKAKTSKAEFDIIPKEISPIELFATAIISCSGTDMVMLPEKQGFKVENLVIEADVVRNESYPQKFNTLHVTYRFDSTADELTARRWVLSSMETYCSTLNTIRSDVKLSYTIVYNGKTIADKENLISGEGMKLTAENAGDIGGCCH